MEEEIEEKEKEDVVKNMEKKHSEALKHKRSFFVRMVSDPKLYNPKIVKVECNFLICLSINKKTKFNFPSRWIEDRNYLTWGSPLTVLI